MTVYFFDTSALLKRYIIETGTPWVQSTTASSANHTIFIAQITPVEIMSGVSRQKRTSVISMRTAKAIRLLINRHVVREYEVVQLSNRIVQHAEDLLEIHPLRAADAIQLASALEVNAKLVAAKQPPLIFVSADTRLLSASTSEGLPTHQPV